MTAGGLSVVIDSLAVGSTSGVPDGDVPRKESDDSMVFYPDSKGQNSSVRNQLMNLGYVLTFYILVVLHHRQYAYQLITILQ